MTKFATDFENLLPAVPELPGIRLLVSTGTVVRSYAVVGMLLTDGSIELIGIEIEL